MCCYRIGVLRGRDRGLHQGAVGAAGPHTEMPAPGRDAGDLQPPPLRGGAPLPRESRTDRVEISLSWVAVGHLKSVICVPSICPGLSVPSGRLRTVLPSSVEDGFSEVLMQSSAERPVAPAPPPGPLFFLTNRASRSQARRGFQDGKGRGVMDKGGSALTSEASR